MLVPTLQVNSLYVLSLRDTVDIQVCICKQQYIFDVPNFQGLEQNRHMTNVRSNFSFRSKLHERFNLTLNKVREQSNLSVLNFRWIFRFAENSLNFCHVAFNFSREPRYVCFLL